MESHSWESPAGLLLRLAACRLVGLSRRYSVHAFHNPGEKKYTSTGSTYGAAQFITSYDYDPLCPQSYTVHSSLECLWWYVHHETNHQWNLHGYCRRVVLSREYGSAASYVFHNPDWQERPLGRHSAAHLSTVYSSRLTAMLLRDTYITRIASGQSTIPAGRQLVMYDRPCGVH